MSSLPICMWSGPRNLSTAMMRSFGTRADCAIIDEPFFAPFLARTGIPHPGREETLAAHETDPQKAAELCTRPPPGGEPYVFQKHMPHHMQPGFPLEWAMNAKHFFLIREPARVIASYAKGRRAFILDDLGFAPQRRLYERITEMTGKAPPVIDCGDILDAPEAVLRALCCAIDIPFDPAMLAWPAGPRDEDGAWAPYWYGSVERSTGFGSPPQSKPTVADEYLSLLAACELDYAALHDCRIHV